MKKVLTVVLLCLPAFGQTAYSGAGQYSGGAVHGGSVGSGPTLAFAQPPQLWVHNFIYPDTQPNPICSPPSGVYATDGVLGQSGPYASYPVTVAGLNSALATWTGGYQRIKIPAGSLLNSATYTTYSGTSPLGLAFSQQSLIGVPIISNPTGCLVVESATPPTRYQMLCSHGLPGFGGTRNPGCTNDIANLWTIRQDDNPGGVSKAAIYFPPGANHVVIRDFEATILPGSSQSATGPARGRKSVLADPEAHDIGVEYAYIHGWNPGDSGQPGAGSGNSAVDNVTGHCKSWAMSGTADTSGTAVTWVSGKRFGMTFSDGTHTYGQTIPQATINLGGTGCPVTSGGTNYTIADHDPAVTDTTLSLSSSAGTQTGVSFCVVNPPSRFTPGCGDDMQNGIEWNADNSWIAWSYIEKQHYWLTEGHSILGGFQNGPVKIAHNWIEGASLGLYFGGGAVDTRQGPVNNVEIRGNYIGHDLNWKYLSAAQGHSPAPPWGAGPLDKNAAHDNSSFQWAIKNSLEFKFCINCLVDGNIIQGSWNDGQDGLIFNLGPRVCSGGSVCGEFDSSGLPRVGFRNIRISNNWFSSAAQGAGTGSRSDGPGNGGGVSMTTTNVDWVNNLFSNIDINTFGDPASNHSNMLLGWGDNGQSFPCNMSMTNGIAHAACGAGTVAGPNANTNIQSIVRTGTPGLTGGTVKVEFSNRHDPLIGGTATLAVTGTGSSNFNGAFTISGVENDINGTHSTTPCDNNATPWVPATNQPCIGSTGRHGDTFIYTDNTNTQVASTDTLCINTGTTCSTAVLGTNALTYQTLGFSITDIVPNQDPILVFSGAYDPDGNGNHGGGIGCNGANAALYATWNSSSNTPMHGTHLPLALAPTNPAGLDVYYQPDSTDTTTNDNSGVVCFLDNGSGGARNVTVQNNTIINGTALAIQNNLLNSQEDYNLIFNNIYAAPDTSTGTCSGKKSFITAGTSCEGTVSIASFDAPTFNLYGNVLQGRTASQWCSSPSGSSGQQTCPSFQSGGAVNSFPSTASCSGSSPDPTCIGFVGFLSGASFQSGGCDNSLAPFNCPQMSLPWANNLTLSQVALSPSSSYAGKGVNTSAMSAAFTSTQYVCPAGLSCGTSGPYKDAP